MTTKIGVTLAMLVALYSWIPSAAAQEADENSDSVENPRQLDRAARRADREAMSGEERAAARESGRGNRGQQRADRESMTPEQRDAARQERRERFESMSPERQAAMKERRAGREQSGDRSSRRGQGQSQRGQGRSQRGQNRQGNRPVPNEQT